MTRITGISISITYGSGRKAVSSARDSVGINPHELGRMVRNWERITDDALAAGARGAHHGTYLMLEIEREA